MSSFAIKPKRSVKELEIWLLKISFGVLFVVFGIFGVFSDALAWDTSFEEYDVDELICDQDIWICETMDWRVGDVYSRTGDKSAHPNKQTNAKVNGIFETAFGVQGVFYSSVLTDFTGTPSATDGLNILIGDGSVVLGYIEFDEQAGRKIYYYPRYPASRIQLGVFEKQTWYDVIIEWDFTGEDDLMRYQVNEINTGWVLSRYATELTPIRISFGYVRWLNYANWYLDDVEMADVCSLENCTACEYWFECQVVGCCWYYQPWYPPPFDNYCDICEGECSYPYNCGLCATETTCEAQGCFWTGDYCTQFEWECGGELACQFCATQETCEAEGCNWNAPTQTCWYVAPTLPSTWGDYYDLHGGYEVPADFVDELAETTGETFIVVSGLFEGFMTSFNTADALAKGSALGNVIPKGRGYLKVFDGLFGHYPIGETFVFILIFMLAIGLFRIARQLIQLVKP